MPSRNKNFVILPKSRSGHGRTDRTGSAGPAKRVVTYSQLWNKLSESYLVNRVHYTPIFDFDFCNGLPVRARVGSGTITAIYYYCYYLV